MKLRVEKQTDIPYPFIECGGHVGLQRSYIICKHVLSGQKADKVVLASDSEMGTASCRKCIDKANRAGRVNAHTFLAVVCEQCAIERGHLIQDS